MALVRSNDIEQRLENYYTKILGYKVWCGYDGIDRAYILRGDRIPDTYIKPDQARRILGIKKAKESGYYSYRKLRGH